MVSQAIEELRGVNWFENDVWKNLRPDVFLLKDFSMSGVLGCFPGDYSRGPFMRSFLGAWSTDRVVGKVTIGMTKLQMLLFAVL